MTKTNVPDESSLRKRPRNSRPQGDPILGRIEVGDLSARRSSSTATSARLVGASQYGSPPAPCRARVVEIRDRGVAGLRARNDQLDDGFAPPRPSRATETAAGRASSRRGGRTARRREAPRRRTVRERRTRPRPGRSRAARWRASRSSRWGRPEHRPATRRRRSRALAGGCRALPSGKPGHAILRDEREGGAAVSGHVRYDIPWPSHPDRPSSVARLPRRPPSRGSAAGRPRGTASGCARASRLDSRPASRRGTSA